MRALLSGALWRGVQRRAACTTLPSAALPPPDWRSVAVRRVSSSAPARKFGDIFTKHVTDYYQEPGDRFIDKTLRNDVEQVKQNELLVSKYLLMIAHDPYVAPDNFLKMFHLMALTNYPLMQLKMDYPKEYGMIHLLAMNCTKRMNYDQLGNFAKCLAELRQQKVKMIDTLRNMIVNECADRVRKAQSVAEGIDYFDVCFEIFGEAFSANPIYETFTIFFAQHLEEASVDHLVRIMHYASLQSKSINAQLVDKALQRVNEVADEMNFIQCVIIANAIMKSGMDFNSNTVFLPRLSSLLSDLVDEEDSEYTSLQVAGMLKVVECFRLARYKDDAVVNNVEKFVAKVNPNLLDIKDSTTFLAYFASCRYNEEIFTQLEKHIIAQVETDSCQLTVPSLARMLWAFSSTGHACSQKLLAIANTDLKMHVKLQGTEIAF